MSKHGAGIINSSVTEMASNYARHLDIKTEGASSQTGATKGNKRTSNEIVCASTKKPRVMPRSVDSTPPPPLPTGVASAVAKQPLTRALTDIYQNQRKIYLERIDKIDALKALLKERELLSARISSIEDDIVKLDKKEDHAYQQMYDTEAKINRFDQLQREMMSLVEDAAMENTTTDIKKR